MTRPSDIPDDVWERAELLTDQFRHIEDDREFVARILMEVGNTPAAAHLGLTARQSEVLVFIDGYVTERGYSPSYRNIADGCGLASKGRAHEIVRQLKERGAVAALPGRVRSIVVTKVGNVSSAHKNIGVA